MTTASLTLPELSERPADGVRQRVVSADFHVCSCESAVRWIADAAPKSRAEAAARYVSVANVADIMSARQDPVFSTAINGSALTVPDGMPVVWALRSMGHGIRENVRGADMMRGALEDPTIASRRHVLIAGTPEARDGLRKAFPNVNWVGELDFFYSKLTEADYEELARQYRDLDPDYAWVSLGGGNQVRFMHRFTPLAKQGVLLGVGAAFDFHAGMIPNPPEWVSRNGFEWLFRLVSEPRRLWRRYLVHNPPFLYHWMRELALGASPEPVISGQMGVATRADAPSGTPRPHFLSPAPRAKPDTPEATGEASPAAVTVVAPLYNEEECIADMMQNLDRAETLLRTSYKVEFVLVDDGSRDATARLVEQAIANRPNYRLVRHDQNRGIAAAIATGIAAASHPIVASIDADGSYDLSILQGMIPMTSAETPMVTASPYHPLGAVEGAPAWRIALSRSASRAYQWVMPQKLSCYTACFRTYHRDSVLDCTPANSGFTGVTELAWNLQRRGREIAEYPAVLRSRQAGVSKMRVSRAALGHLRLMTKIAAESTRDRVLGKPHFAGSKAETPRKV